MILVGLDLILLPLMNKHELHTTPLCSIYLPVYDRNFMNQFLVPSKTNFFIEYKPRFPELKDSSASVKPRFVPDDSSFFIMNDAEGSLETRTDRYGEDLTYVFAEDIHFIADPFKNKKHQHYDRFTQAAIHYVDHLQPTVPILLYWR